VADVDEGQKSPERETVTVDWKILPAEQILGNEANKFDTWRQSDTLGPHPPSPDEPPPETDGRGNTV
jgi:hypothetical protein